LLAARLLVQQNYGDNNYPRLVIMSGACESLQIAGALGQHPSGSLVAANIFFAEFTTYHHRGQGGRLQRLHLQWWLLPAFGQHPPGGATIGVTIFGGGYCQSTDSTPRGARHRHHLVAATGLLTAPPRGAHHRRRLHLRWWLLLDYRQHPPGGPPSMSSSSSVVAAVGLPTAPLRGPFIDV
jgi:hypothetical protein